MTHTHASDWRAQAWKRPVVEQALRLKQRPHITALHRYLLRVNRLVQLHGVDVLVRLHRVDGILGEGDTMRFIPRQLSHILCIGSTSGRTETHENPLIRL